MPHPWFSIRLIHPEAPACVAFEAGFVGLAKVSVEQTRYEALADHHCFVTAGNSYGLMTAGIDAAVIHRFGPELMRRVQDHIMNEWFGEQPIGSAFVIDTGDPARPWICHAPTMRMPGSIMGTSYVYTATLAALIAIHRHNLAHDPVIETVVLPAMGTGFGGVAFDEAARQMAVAYRHYLRPPGRPSWDSAIARERAICYAGETKVVRS